MCITQIPSNRTYDLAPVYSLDQHMKQEKESPVPLPVGLLGMGLMLTIAGVGKKVKNIRKHKRASSSNQEANNKRSRVK